MTSLSTNEREYDLHAKPSVADSRLMLAIRDLLTGLALWRVWGRLGWNDILQRYRRSILGPFWLTASAAVMAISLGVLYAKLFQSPIDEFLPYLCVGLLLWGYISSFLIEAGTMFIGSESYIKQIRLPYTVYVYRAVWSKVIILAHNFVIYFGVIAYFRIWPGSLGLLAIPGFVLVTLNGAAASLLVGMLSARFRDIPQLIASLIQLVFFATPIMWKIELLKEHAFVAMWNPFYSFIEIVRAPLLGQWPSATNYLVVLLVTALNLLVAGTFFARFRSRIAYWV
jgi:ABC-2 type transport system permease protein/lipopolysaccharide transport system permease protein